MASAETFQIPLEAAELYESRFVPAIFAEWAPLLVDTSGVGPGQAVLDVACGTGIVARTVADRIGADGAVVGLDRNEAMLTVARRVRPDLTWQRGDVANLPFPARTFDTVLCQMALMYFPDQVTAIAEMARVATAGGTVAIAVPASLTDQPAYEPLADVVIEAAGPEAGALITETQWSCGDLDQLRGWFDAAGLRVETTRTHLGAARFGSIDELVATEVEGSPLISRIDQATYDDIKRGAQSALRPFVTDTGAVHAPLRGHIVVGRVA